MDSTTDFRNIPVLIPGRQIVKESTIQPVQKVVEEMIQVQPGQTKILRNEPVIAPVEYTEETVTRDFQAPSKEVIYQPVYEKKIINNKERIEIIPGQTKVVQLNSYQRDPIFKEKNTVQTVQLPGKDLIKETVVVPIVQRENVDLQVL